MEFDLRTRQAFLTAFGREVNEAQQPETPVDDFFASEPGLIAVFDFDYESKIAFHTKLTWAQFLLVPPAWISCIACVPCFINKNIQWKSRAQHVALTVDGIRYVEDKHPTCWGLSCCDRGRESKTVPYDKITDCDMQEPAGTACCCCIERVLSQVRVDTASSGSKDGVPRHELVLEGLRFSKEFKQAVWLMKRGEPPPNASVPLNASTGLNMGPAASAPSQMAMTNRLLTEIRDELRELNARGLRDDLRELNTILRAKA